VVSLACKETVNLSPMCAAMQPGSTSGTPGAKSNRLSKKTFCPWINRQIMIAADSGNVSNLLGLIDEHLMQMNMVNLSTALHRMAKLAGSCADVAITMRQHPTLRSLAERVHAMIERAKSNSSWPQCQALSNITWAFATLDYLDLPLLVEASTVVCNNIKSFKAFELSMTLWAFAKLGEDHREARKCGSRLFKVAAEHMKSHTSEFPFRCLVMSAWAFATAKRSHQQLFEIMAPELLLNLTDANPLEISNIVWSYAAVGVKHDELFMQIGDRVQSQLHLFMPQEF